MRLTPILEHDRRWLGLERWQRLGHMCLQQLCLAAATSWRASCACSLIRLQDCRINYEDGVEMLCILGSLQQCRVIVQTQALAKPEHGRQAPSAAASRGSRRRGGSTACDGTLDHSKWAI